MDSFSLDAVPIPAADVLACHDINARGLACLKSNKYAEAIRCFTLVLASNIIGNHITFANRRYIFISNICKEYGFTGIRYTNPIAVDLI